MTAPNVSKELSGGRARQEQQSLVLGRVLRARHHRVLVLEVFIQTCVHVAAVSNQAGTAALPRHVQTPRVEMVANAAKLAESALWRKSPQKT